MTKCQKITFFDIFHKICQNHTFPLFPIFPKNQKITFFHCGGDFCKIPNFPIFPKMPIFGISRILTIFGISWKLGFSRKWSFLGFWGICQKWPILGFLGKWSKMGFSGDTPQNGDFWTITMCDFPHTHYMEGSILQTPEEYFYIFLISIF